MNTDIRELLESAAKACGIRLEWDGPPNQWQPMHYEGKTYHAWNPLESIADRARMEDTLTLNVIHQPNGVRVEKYIGGSILAVFERLSDHNNDRPAAHSMASLRVAAAMGEGKK